jgi:hypothetical protein
LWLQISNPKFPACGRQANPKQAPIKEIQNPKQNHLSIWNRCLDSYMFKSKNFLLTFYAPSPFPSPQRGEGGGEGKFQIFLARIYL